MAENENYIVVFWTVFGIKEYFNKRINFNERMSKLELSCRELLRECLRMDQMKRELYSRHELLFEEFLKHSSPSKIEIEYVIYMLEDVLTLSTTCFREVVRSLIKHVTPEFLDLCKKHDLLMLLRQRLRRVISHWFRNNKSQLFTRTNYKDYLRVMKLIFG